MKGSQHTHCSFHASGIRRPIAAGMALGMLFQVAPVGQCARAEDSDRGHKTLPAPCSTSAPSLSSFLAAARSETGLFRIDLFAQSTPLPVNQLVSLLLVIHGNRSPSDRFELTQVTADMVAHRHGMYTQPVVRPCALNPATGLTGFIVEGIQLHMRGVWTLQFIARGTEAIDQAEIDIRI